MAPLLEGLKTDGGTSADHGWSVCPKPPPADESSVPSGFLPRSLGAACSDRAFTVRRVAMRYVRRTTERWGAVSVDFTVGRESDARRHLRAAASSTLVSHDLRGALDGWRTICSASHLLREVSGRSADQRGDVAQLVEHLLCKQEVAGSSPAVSTIEAAYADSGGLSRWTPSRTARVAPGVGQPHGFLPVETHRIESDSAVAIAFIRDPRPIRRPVRTPIVSRIVRKSHDARTIRVHQVYLWVSVSVADERDPASIG